MITEWRQIDGFPDYYVSNYGEIWSEKTKRLLKHASDKDGYQIATLYRDGKYKKYKVHRIVAAAFLSIDIDGMQINHIDENPSNNRLDNLEICNATYNINYGSRNKKVSHALRCNKNIKRKAVEAIDNSGSVVMRFESMHDAERSGYNRTAIYMICNSYGRLKTHKGFVWRYAQ